MAYYKPKYTEEQKQKCIILFNRTELRPGEETIDNTDKAIAKELNIGVSSVSEFIREYLNKKNE